MTDIEALAREAGASVRLFGTLPDGTNQFLGADFKPDALTRFAALIRAHALDEAAWMLQTLDPGREEWDSAAAVRALKDKP